MTNYGLRSTNTFDKWLNKLKAKDRSTSNRVLARLDRAVNGNFGDHKQLNPDLFELRFTIGKGLRIYYTIQNSRIIFLLSGGNKATQDNDIKKAKKMLDKLK